MENLVLEIKNASLGYENHIVLDDFNLSLSKGEKYLLLGPNGAGKTTLLKSILKIIPLLNGTLKTDGQIAYCKQDYQNINFPITVEEVVSMGLYNKKLTSVEKEQLISSALLKTEAQDLRKRLFNTLSGGERQRVSLARCFTQEANLLLLDEPTSFMDKESRNSLISLLSSESLKNMAIIAVTHDDGIISKLNWNTIRLG